jgi:hypothetical protein
MKIQHLITLNAAILVAIFITGCSKSSIPPIIKFEGYHARSDGNFMALVLIRNPNPSPIVCQLKVQPRDPLLAGGRELEIAAGDGFETGVFVSNTNALSLDVIVFRTVPAHHLTVPMQ